MQWARPHAAASVPLYGRCNVRLGSPAYMYPLSTELSSRRLLPCYSMHAPALGFVCGGGTEGDGNRLRRQGVRGGCGEVVTCLPTCSSISTTTTCTAWAYRCTPYPLHWCCSPSPSVLEGCRTSVVVRSAYIKGQDTHKLCKVLLGGKESRGRRTIHPRLEGVVGRDPAELRTHG